MLASRASISVKIQYKYFPETSTTNPQLGYSPIVTRQVEKTLPDKFCIQESMTKKKKESMTELRLRLG